MPTVKELAGRVKALEETLSVIRKAFHVITTQLPIISSESLELISGVAMMLRGMKADGLRLPRLEIVNEAGQPVLVLQPAAGTGELCLYDAEGRLKAKLLAASEAGRLDLIADTGAVHSFGPRRG